MVCVEVIVGVWVGSTVLVLVFVGVFEFVGLWEGKGVESGVLV